MKSAAAVVAICFIACSTTSQAIPVTPKATTISSQDMGYPEDISDNARHSICPDDMQHVSGLYCTEVVQNCLTYLDPPGTKFNRRCAEFAPSVCTGKKVHMDFCIDIEEHHPADSNIPTHDVSWNQAAQMCAQEGKQLCQENQWTFACEGEEMYPHTTGYTRPSDKCNFDKGNLVVNGVFVDQAQPITENPQCVSPFGIHNMNGNVDEWVILDRPYYTGHVKMLSGLKGGWWMPARDRCRPVTVGHNEVFHEIQIGFRCCKETQ